MIVGRNAERQALDSLLDDARESRSGVVVVRGEPGVGKSSLLRYTGERAEGMRILRAVGVEFEAELPFAGLHQLLRPVADRLSDIPDAQAAALAAALGLAGERDGDSFLVGAGVLSLLADAAEESPLLCLVDDAQWLDQASREALRFVARRLDQDGIALVVAERFGVEPFLPGAAELSLRPLSSAEAGELLVEHVSVEPALAVRSRLVDASGGNPLALLELAQGLTERQLTGHEPLPDPLPVSTGVEASFRERVARLPEDSRTLLLVSAAEAGGDVAVVARAGEALGVDLEALAPAEQEGLVTVSERRISFRHPLARSAVYGDATFAERRRAHTALAATLMEPADADRRAWHRAATTVGTDDAVAAELEQTADRAGARSGHAAASVALERAAELSTEGADRARRLVRAASAALRGGEPDRALALLERAEPLPEEPELRARAAWVRGLYEIYRGSPGKAVPLLVGVAEELASADPARALPLAFLAAWGASYSGDFNSVRDLGEWLSELDVGEGVAERFMLDFLHGLTAIFKGSHAAGVPAFRRCLAVADQLEDERLLHVAATAASYVGDEMRAEELLARGVAQARAHGNVAALPLTLARLATLEEVRAKLPAAYADASEALRLARETGQVTISALALVLLAYLAALRGDEEECRRLADEALAAAVPRRFALATAAAALALGELDLCCGRAEEAFTRLDRLVNGEDEHPFYRLFAVPRYAEAAAWSGNGARALRAIEMFAGWADEAGAVTSQALAARSRALVAEGAEAESWYREALRLHEERPIVFDRARTELSYGEFLRRGKRKTEAREALRSALETFESLGARPWAERARRELEATGETIRRRDEAREELTPQELQVARLVATGATNKEVAAQLFLSPKTVEYHLRKVFLKLGIHARGELIRLDLESESLPAHV